MAIHSDMQGPCETGFHVPLSSEWTAVKNARVYMGGGSSDGTNFSRYLKLPFAGKKYRTNGNIGEKTTLANYWSSTYSGNTVSVFYMISTSIIPDDAEYSSAGLSIRPFKDEPVVPDNNRTILYSAAALPEDNNISRSSSLGLITITYTRNGNTYRITMADKNLGATTVWNSGDTLSEANCGKYYQWGNNYGFSRNGGGATSSTQVDASAYGPGNYYESSTFITRSSDGWDSSINRNLRGGVSQGTWETFDSIKLHGHIGTWHMEWVPESYDYSAMQGPCPDGYHIPTVDERTNLIHSIIYGVFNIYLDTGNLGTYLRMPAAGRLSNSSGSLSGSGNVCYCWACEIYGVEYGNPFRGYDFYARENYNSWVDDQYITYGQNIRPFKDTPVIPDNSWTTIYDGSSIAIGAGIFHNSTLGLISVSGDGINWMTITDKNLGATIVYNQGDTLAENNCGYFYQWGNNNPFPRSGATTTSSTQVDASNYGPGDYYNSSTFIKRSESPYGWDSSNNPNLRGGVTGKVITPGYYKRR